MKLFKLDKIVLSITNGARDFLNGITSNALDKPHNAFVDFHGKIVAIFDQREVSEDKFFIAVEESCLDGLMRHLERYIKLSKVVIQKENYGVYFDLTGKYKVQEDEFVFPQKTGQLIVTSRRLEHSVSEEEFTLFRLKNNMPLQGIDYRDEFLLNVSDDQYVSYAKGCFLGQEFIAKVHNRSKPSWKLTVKSEDECSEDEKRKMTSKAADPQTGKTLGFVFVHNC